MLIGLLLMGVGGCSGFSNGDESSESGIAGDGSGGASGVFGGDGSGWHDDGDVSLIWWWYDHWGTGTCVKLQVYNHSDGSIEWEGIHIGLDDSVEELTWAGGGVLLIQDADVIVYPTSDNYHLSKYGTMEFGFCGEPAARPISFDIDAHGTGGSGWDGWGDDDDDWGDDDDDCDDWWNDCGDDDDDDCDSLLFGQLEYGNIRLAYMDAGYETNCGRCIRMQLYSTGTDYTYCNLEATVSATAGYELTYAESMAWDHDPHSNVITLTGMWDDDLDEWDMWEGRICINPDNDAYGFDFIDLEISAQQGEPNECP
jgi:hypothetical protein